MFQGRKIPRHFVISLCSTLLLIVFASLDLALSVNLGYVPLVQASTVASAANDLAQKPYLGWSSWSLESTKYPGYNTPWLTEANVKAQADVLHQKLQVHGYQYVNIDAGWWMDYNWNPTYDAYGRPAPIRLASRTALPLLPTMCTTKD